MTNGRSSSGESVARCPVELQELVKVTTGIEYGGTVDGRLDLGLQDEGVYFDAGMGGGERLLRVFDYGNGDGLYLEAYGETCRLWWFGHDPWLCVLVARSIHEYLARYTALAEAAARAEDVDREPFAPARQVGAQKPSTVLRAGRDAAPMAFLRALPEDAWVYDFRREMTPVEAEAPSFPDAAGREIRRVGEIVAMVPRAARAQERADHLAAERSIEEAIAYASMELYVEAARALDRARGIEPDNPRIAVVADILAARGS